MERVAIFVNDPVSLDCAMQYLREGWLIDPDLKILRLESAAIYHLVKYSEEEAQAMAQTALEDRVVSLKSVAIEETDTYLAQGYEVKDTFAKTVTLEKREQVMPR